MRRAEWERTKLALSGIAILPVRLCSRLLFGPIVYRGPRTRPALALTFDDGPSESTPDLLRILSASGIRATFFQCGANVDRLGSVSAEVAAAGHQLGNHSYSHRALCPRGPAFIHGELARAQESIARASGTPPRVFRAPYGVRWFGLQSALGRLGLREVMWTVIGRDWVLPAGRVAERLRAAARPGAIIALHDGRGTTPRPDLNHMLNAVRRLLPELLDAGYRFETLDQLLCPTN